MPIRGAEALLSGADQDLDAAQLSCHFLGERGGSVRAAVIDDQHVGIGHGGTQGAQERHDVLRLVVGR